MESSSAICKSSVDKWELLAVVMGISSPRGQVGSQTNETWQSIVYTDRLKSHML